MNRGGRRKPVDPSSFLKYRDVGRALRNSANDLATLSEDGAEYGNATGICAIHACIAYSDAICIKLGGFKSSEGEHIRAADALREVLGNRLDEGALKAFRRALSQKDQISYQGDYYTVDEARRVVDDMNTFCDWAHAMLG
ncbi:MAG TPA: hypothetical protein VMN60_10750 [Longimicrobiales bacterium]|nr:hypothetical protein [Longimicrobiales bacterium]